MIRTLILSASLASIASPGIAQPVARVEAANRAALREPSHDGYLHAVQIYPYGDGVLYRLYAAPERVSDIALQPGEALISVAAGDTVRWTVGDTTSGSDASKRTHLLVKPFSAGLNTNLVITTDRRVYRLKLTSTQSTSMTGVAWTYPQDELLALQRQAQAAEAAQPVSAGIEVERLNFNYRISGDRPAWLPVRAFDDGRQTWIEFPASMAVGEAPPLFVLGDDSEAQLVNYRVSGRYYVVDRLFGAAELRLGGKKQKIVRITRIDASGKHRAGEGIVTEPHSSSEIPTPKVDPESLVLRANPARVTRFRRGAIVLIAGAGATVLAGIGWIALKPVSLGLIAPDEERGSIAAKVPADALPGAPSSYGDVPKLGPALPGDLGRPILNRQRGMGVEPIDPAAEAAAKASQEAQAERQRLAAEQKAARESSVMLQLAGNPAAAGAAALMSAPETGAAPQVDVEPNGPQRKNTLVGRANDGAAINPHALESPVSPWTLHAGSVIAASLITGLNSDLPGLVTAQVTENVYDSVTGRTLLIPQGARIIGSYDDVVAFGQNRALVVWQRIILPDGASIRIDNVPATDTQGYAGLSDRVDRHTWQLLKGVALSTLLGVGTELGFGSSETDLVRAIREAAQQSGARAGDQLVMKNLDVQPTLKVRPGWPLRVVVHKDLVLEPWRR